MIPVQRPYLGAEELAAVGRVFETRWLGMGSATKQFEDALRQFLGARHVIAVNTGTSALHIALAALGVGPDDELIGFLKARGIGCGVHYIPNHLQPLFSRYRVPLPVTDRVWGEIVTLPLYYEMTDDECEQVIGGVQEFCRARGG